MKHFLSVFIFLTTIYLSNTIAQKQSVAVDTIYIQALIDSSKGFYESMDAEKSIVTGENAISIIGISLANSDVMTSKKLKAQKATLLRIIGNNYKDIFTDFPKALDYYQRSLKVASEVDDKVNSAGSLFNTGSIYNELKEYKKALEYLNRSLKMFESINHTGGIAIANSSIGAVYNSLNQDSLALKYYRSSLNLYNEMQDTSSAARQLNSIAEIFVKQKRYGEAMGNYQTSLKMFEAIGDSFDVAFSLAGIGVIYQDGKKDFKNAENYFLQALKISKKFNLELYKNVLNALKDLYHIQGRHKEAYEMYCQYDLIKDSISNQQNIHEVLRRELVTDFGEKQSKLQAEREKDAAVADEKSRKQKVIIWAAVVGLLLIGVFSVFMFNRWRLTQRQNKIIEAQKSEVESQKHLIEEKQKEIIDSITYAKRLQEAILPPLDFIKNHLPDSFVFYKPKDIVAGDFYFMEVVDNTIFIAAADCTGHGVPGAMVSVVCCNALNRTVKEFGLRETGKILDKVTELVLETFERSDKDVKDGMDISLMSINIATKEVKWSGANNALWYISNDEVIEIKADKQPIGKHENRKPFTTHRIDYLPNTIFYLYTDGYADQFGGPKGKKFKYKQLEENLLISNTMQYTDQQVFLENIFSKWKGELEQVDDVCIIGIRV